MHEFGDSLVVVAIPVLEGSAVEGLGRSVVVK
jgi:hypothetical protein